MVTINRQMTIDSANARLARPIYYHRTRPRLVRPGIGSIGVSFFVGTHYFRLEGLSSYAYGWSDTLTDKYRWIQTAYNYLVKWKSEHSSEWDTLVKEAKLHYDRQPGIREAYDYLTQHYAPYVEEDDFVEVNVLFTSGTQTQINRFVSYISQRTSFKTIPVIKANLQAIADLGILHTALEYAMAEPEGTNWLLIAGVLAVGGVALLLIAKRKSIGARVKGYSRRVKEGSL